MARLAAELAEARAAVRRLVRDLEWIVQDGCKRQQEIAGKALADPIVRKIVEGE